MFNARISARLWGSALLLTYIATAIFLLWFLYLAWWTTTINTGSQSMSFGGTSQHLLMRYTIMAFFYAASIIMLRRGWNHPKLVGVVIMAFGVFLFSF